MNSMLGLVKESASKFDLKMETTFNSSMLSTPW